jgi:hypothetical protein
MKIFWSWQNDTPPKRNRHFIRAALSDAVAAIADDFALDDAERPEFDHDTKDTPGMAEIAATILDKIRSCAVFIADLTPIVRSADGKALPNPNVLIELGWALHKPGADRIIAVMNTADGWGAEDLPFDIRHRRALLYNLPEGADRATLKTVRNRLVEELTGAIRTNLKNHLEQVAGAQLITGVPAKVGEPSLWDGAGSTFTHHDSFGRDHATTVVLPAAPRGYIRVIPSGWSNRPPTVDEIAQLHDRLAVQPQAEGTSSGNFGATEQGYVRYWLTGKDDEDRYEAANVAMYFEDTGEFWVLHGTAIGATHSRTVLRYASLIGGWSKVLRRANAVFDRFGAYPLRRVELGLTGISGVRWPGSYQTDSPPARRPVFVIERQGRNWGSVDQYAILDEALAGLRNLFALQKPSPVELRQILAQYDPERQLPEPKSIP